ncbi:MAG: DUF4910 domain-containing protein [Rhodospirillaceae bacterium]|nr:DUF4910 domain-containing protein [Rhodospirillaceae bacterium]
MYALAADIFPLCRSISGDGVRQTLKILQREIPALKIHEVPTGTPCFDWEIPREWNIRDGYIIDPAGAKIVDFKKHNMHVMSYSVPVDREIGLEELQEHLISVADRPNDIPYATSYYRERWGFCLSHAQRQALKAGAYRVKIDSTLAPGSMTYGELLLPGETEQEVLLSTYTCHPSMANNETSGPVVTTFLAKWLSGLKRRRLSYRIVFIPETIGSIYYLSRHAEAMKRNTIAGFVVSCVGDDRDYSILPSRQGDTLADRVAHHVLKHTRPDYKTYSFAYDRGSDERQYCAPGIDLPVAVISRSLFEKYPEYHTSADDLSCISPAGLAGGYTALKHIIEVLEGYCYPKATTLCEPQLSKHGLYPTVGAQRNQPMAFHDMRNLIAYADGTKSILEIADELGRPAWQLQEHLDAVVNAGVLTVSAGPQAAAPKI